MVEFYTWADKIAAELKQRHVKEHVVHGMWTPSGYFHIGNARNELLAPSLMHDALRDAGLKVVFNFFVDDFDDLDKIPADIRVPKGFEKNMGRPLYEVASPVSGYKSWSDFFSSEILEVIDKFGVKPNIFSSYEEYHKGTYDNAVRIVLNNWQKVRDVWVRITKTKKERNFIPVMPVCENCGRAATTLAVEWDGTHLKYSCSQNREYAESCGYEGELAPGKGNVKLPWRIHWPATWFTFHVTFESGGRDHFAAGGSVDTGRAFCKEVFGTEPPHLLRGDYVTINGKKISGSSGNVISMKDWLEIAEPELLRFVYISYQPSTVIEFDISSNKFFLVTDRYDEAEGCYYGVPSVTEKRTAQLKRQYELAQLTKPPKEQPVRVSYSMLAMILQVVPHKSAKSIAKMLLDMGALKDELGVDDLERLGSRIKFVGDWLAKYATDDVKVRVNEHAPSLFAEKLTKGEKSALEELRRELEKDYTEADLQSAVYEIARKNDVEPKRFFQIIYQLLVNKNSGPRLGPFILAVGKEKVSRLLEDISK